MAKSVVDMALSSIDLQIAELQRAREIIVAASASVPSTDAPKVRKPRKRKGGLPTNDPEKF